jgi:hypothetical protein
MPLELVPYLSKVESSLPLNGKNPKRKENDNADGKF